VRVNASQVGLRALFVAGALAAIASGGCGPQSPAAAKIEGAIIDVTGCIHGATSCIEHGSISVVDGLEPGGALRLSSGASIAQTVAIPAGASSLGYLRVAANDTSGDATLTLTVGTRSTTMTLAGGLAESEVLVDWPADASLRGDVTVEVSHGQADLLWVVGRWN
jgi:hypothetical protein